MTDSSPGSGSFIPEYNRPDSPGIAMNFDNTVSIYQRVELGDTFESAVEEAFNYVREAQDKFPNWPRIYYLEIVGHKGDRHGFDDEFFEFQQETIGLANS